MSDSAYQWGDEHFCEPDVVKLNEQDRDLAARIGYPVQLDAPPEPPTFCSYCLMWWSDPAHTGSAHRPPEKGTHHG